jgi:hypothetical protein
VAERKAVEEPAAKKRKTATWAGRGFSKAGNKEKELFSYLWSGVCPRPVTFPKAIRGPTAPETPSPGFTWISCFQPFKNFPPTRFSVQIFSASCSKIWTFRRFFERIT